MPSNQTPNYQLSQWEAGDRVQRTDFNADNAKIDAAIKAVAQTAAGKGNCQIAYGSYIGTGKYGEDNPSTLTFPFQPKFVLLTPSVASNAVEYMIAVQGQTICCTFNTNGGYTIACSWNSSSFTWYSADSSVQFNSKNHTYFYVALG